jgi:hypothetical protein
MQRAEQQIQFMLEVLNSILNSNGDPQVVYPLLQQNLVLLDDLIIEVLKPTFRR